jgi:hypothetical protein
MMAKILDELEIIKVLAGSIDRKKFPFQLARSFIYLWECDYWTMNQEGETREYEIKISRADYKKDFEKDKHKTLNGANYFYYVCPKNMIIKSEVYDKYGLIYVWDNGFIEVVKKPKRLNNNVYDNWRNLACKFYWKFYGLWKDKYLDKEITHDQYHEGFNFDLTEVEI